MFRQDPGPCPICGEAHSACTGDSGRTAIEIPQLPMRDGLPPAPMATRPVLRADAVQATLPPGQTTSAHYRGKAKR